jgi:hypothetical protein
MMKCARCGIDTRRRDRIGGRCPHCGGQFAFNQGRSDPVTDATFARAIEAVSGRGQVRWGVEHLYYEVSRRVRRSLAKSFSVAVLTIALLYALYALWRIIFTAQLSVVGAQFKFWFTVVAVSSFILLWYAVIRKRRRRRNLPQGLFNDLWKRWCAVHGVPKGVILRRQNIGETAMRATEPDLELYSFDRAVICDRARTVDLLLANNFHFENNCAVLSVDGYPRGAFSTVLAMLRRNPRLMIFALHDCTGPGCALARRLASDPKWFRGQRVIDVGLRPVHARNLPNLIAAKEMPAAILGVSREDFEWLSRHNAELAILRPEQVLRRLFHAMSKVPEDDDGAELDGSGERRERAVGNDDDSFSTDEALGDSGADSFG